MWNSFSRRLSYKESPKASLSDAETKRKDKILSKMISSMGTQFSTPEYIILTYEQPGNEMFYIMNGDCMVNIRDHNMLEHSAVRLLTEGQHFGEIALLYEGAKRTTEIVSRNYVTLATIRKRDLLNTLASELPEYILQLKNHVYKYNYPLKTFLRNIFKRC